MSSERKKSNKTLNVLSQRYHRTQKTSCDSPSGADYLSLEEIPNMTESLQNKRRLPRIVAMKVHQDGNRETSLNNDIRRKNNFVRKIIFYI